MAASRSVSPLDRSRGWSSHPRDPSCEMLPRVALGGGGPPAIGTCAVGCPTPPPPLLLPPKRRPPPCTHPPRPAFTSTNKQLAAALTHHPHASDHPWVRACRPSCQTVSRHRACQSLAPHATCPARHGVAGRVCGRPCCCSGGCGCCRPVVVCCVNVVSVRCDAFLFSRGWADATDGQARPLCAGSLQKILLAPCVLRCLCGSTDADMQRDAFVCGDALIWIYWLAFLFSIVIDSLFFLGLLFPGLARCP